MTQTDRAIEFVARFDPGFPQSIEGASPEEIRILESLTPTSLPDVYRDFLARLGRDCDWLNIRSADFRINSVITFYRERQHEVPPNYLLIGLNGNDVGDDIYLDSSASGPPTVIALPVDGVDDLLRSGTYAHIGYVAGSLPEMLCTDVVYTMRIEIMPQRGRIVPKRSDRDVERVDTVFTKAGFELQWFSNEWHKVYLRQDAALVMSVHPDNLLAIDFGTETKVEYDRLIGTVLGTLNS